MKAWDQRDDESSKSFSAFCLYLDLPPAGRSLDKAYAVHYQRKHGQPIGNVKKAPGTWTHWSKKHQWSDRAIAYDAHQQRKAMIRTVNRRQKDVEQFIAQDMLIAQGVQRITSRKVAALMNQEPTEVSATELRQVVMAYDGARGWLTELIGLFDDEANPINQLAMSDEVLAQRLEED